jgi:acyl-CoA thioesterase
MNNEVDPAALARACAEAMWNEDRASQSLGMAIESVAPGQARLAMRVADHMVNGHGLCHGGYIFALADSAFAFACNTYNARAVASHCDISFLRPAHLGDRLVADATERARAGRGGIYDVAVRRADGTLIAEFRGHSRLMGERFFAEHGGEPGG